MRPFRKDGSARLKLFQRAREQPSLIVTFVHASNQMLDDVPAMAAFIDSQLRMAINNKLDAQLLYGDGVNPNVLGLTLAHDVNALCGADRSPSRTDLLQGTPSAASGFAHSTG